MLSCVALIASELSLAFIISHHIHFKYNKYTHNLIGQFSVWVTENARPFHKGGKRQCDIGHCGTEMFVSQSSKLPSHYH